MLFNSFAFAVFLPTVFAIYWLIPHKYRWIVLMVSSYYFYMSWNARYVLLILGVTVITYLGAICIRRVGGQREKNCFGSGCSYAAGYFARFQILEFCGRYDQRSLSKDIGSFAPSDGAVTSARGDFLLYFPGSQLCH